MAVSRILSARLRDLCLSLANFLRRSAPKIAGEAEFRERPNDPFGWIDIPEAHAVAIVVLKFVMIVVIAFPQREQREKPGIPRAAFGRVGLTAHDMTRTVDQEGAVLHNDDASDAGD